MAAAGKSRRMEEKDLAYARGTVQRILGAWDSKTPNQLLAKDIVLSVSLGAQGESLIGCRSFGTKVKVTGREQAKRVLSGFYSDLRRGLSVSTEVVSGYDAVLLGELAIPASGDDRLSMPIILHMEFDDEGMIEKMTIAGADPNPVIIAIRGAVRKALRAGRPKRS